MMTSSRDEFNSKREEPAVAIDHLTVIRASARPWTTSPWRIAPARSPDLGPSGCGKTTLIRSIVGTPSIAPDGHVLA